MKQKEEEYQIIKKMPVPNQNVIATLYYINNQSVDEAITAVDCYNYGYRAGIRSERDLNKWNSMSCYYNMRSYILEHNGELPKSYGDLQQWVVDTVKRVKQEAKAYDQDKSIV